MLTLEQQNALRDRYRQAHPGWQPATERYAALVRDALQPASRLLDLGCGRGGLVEQLAHPLQQMVGIDPDLISLREHRLPLPRAQAFSHPLPFPSRTFDVICASWLLEHLHQPEAVFCEIERVLRPGGLFIFVTPNRRHPLARLNELLGRAEKLQGWLVERLYGRRPADTFPTVYRANCLADLHRLAATCGLRLKALETIADPTYLIFTPVLFPLMQQVEMRLPPQRKIHLVGCLERPL